METFTIEEGKGKATLRICGDVTIQNISEFKRELLRLQETGKRLAINLEAIGEADVACLQMICCAHRTWLGMDKRVEIEGMVPDGFRRLLVESGYLREGGCRMFKDKPCLWERRC